MSVTESWRETVEALHLNLHDRRIGVITHCSGGKNILTFEPEYAALPGGDSADDDIDTTCGSEISRSSTSRLTDARSAQG